MFQVYQAVKVVDESLELFGQVGRVVALANDKGQYGVKMDESDETFDFEPSAIRGL